MEQLFFNSFIENDNESIQINTIFKKLSQLGFLEDDPRLIQILNNFRSLNKITVTFEEFKECIDKHICIFS